jgi:hypothetical protein
LTLPNPEVGDRQLAGLRQQRVELADCHAHALRACFRLLNRRWSRRLTHRQSLVVERLDHVIGSQSGQRVHQCECRSEPRRGARRVVQALRFCSSGLQLAGDLFYSRLVYDSRRRLEIVRLAEQVAERTIIHR